MIYEKALCERKRLEKKIKQLHKEIDNLPNGKLICSTNGKYKKCYISNGHTKTYIPTKQRKLIEELAKKKYLEAQISDYLHEIVSIDSYLRHHDLYCNKADNLLKSSSKYHDLLSNYFQPLSQELYSWANENYERNNEHPEHLIHTCLSGNIVRSKTESLIDMLLTQNKIPFRYECKLKLGTIDCYPDFTIRHPKTGEIYYWEHFGMIDNNTYADKAIYKLQNYIRNGIYPSINLIVTYETQSRPLTPDRIQSIIEYYFL